MKYTKPHITNTQTAALAIMNDPQAKISGSADNSQGLGFVTNPAYSADE
jgi:hypothetical protein